MSGDTLEQIEYAVTWKKWEPKVVTTVRQWSLAGVVGCTFDDFFSLAQQVLLYTLQNFNSDKAKLSTFFYTNLHNAFKTEYAKSGLVRSGWHVKIVDKKTDQEQVLSRQYTSREEADAVATSIGRKRRRAMPVYKQENRFKRIPPTHLEGFERKSDNEDDECGILSPNERLGISDRRRSPEFVSLARAIGRRVVDRTDRRLLLRLYSGESLRDVTKGMKMTRVDLNKRMKSLRRVAVDVMREFRF